MAFYVFEVAWVYPTAYSVGRMPLLPQILTVTCREVPQSVRPLVLSSS